MLVRVDKKGPHAPLLKARKCTTRKIPLFEKEGQGDLVRVSFFLRHLPSYGTPVSRRFQSRNGPASVDNQFLC
jgi:hypothetical protein